MVPPGGAQEMGLQMWPLEPLRCEGCKTGSKPPPPRLSGWLDGSKRQLIHRIAFGCSGAHGVECARLAVQNMDGRLYLKAKSLRIACGREPNPTQPTIPRLKLGVET